VVTGNPGANKFTIEKMGFKAGTETCSTHLRQSADAIALRYFRSAECAFDRKVDGTKRGRQADLAVEEMARGESGG